MCSNCVQYPGAPRMDAAQHALLRYLRGTHNNSIVCACVFVHVCVYVRVCVCVPVCVLVRAICVILAIMSISRSCMMR